MSLVALSFAATKAYFLQRTSPHSDPDPPLLKNVLLVLPLFVALTFVYEVTWTFVLAYLEAAALVPAAVALLFGVLLFKDFRLELGLVLSKHHSCGADDEKQAI